MLRVLFGFLLATFFGFTVAKHGQPCANEGRRNSFLWKIKRNPPAYFFGTIHVPYTRVWSHIPSFSKRAFRSSDNVFFELDLTNADTRASLTRCQMLPGGTDLREILPSDLYRRLKSHLDYVRRAMPGWLTSEQEGKGWYGDALFEAIAGNWERKRPVWVMLMVNSLTEADIRTQGIPVLDLHLAHKAVELGKHVGAVEEVDEQCKPLNGLNMSQVLYALNYTLLMQERMRFGAAAAPYTTDDLIQQYNCGDLNSSIFDSDSSQFPKLTNDTDLGDNEKGREMANNVDYYFRKELIYRRNERMAHRVKSLLQKHSDESFFFAFGAGHFLGNGSVLDFLRKDGFEIEHSDGVESDADDSLPVSTDLNQFTKGGRNRNPSSNSRRAARAQRRRSKQRRRKSERNGRRKKNERKGSRTSTERSSRKYDEISSYEIRDGVYQNDPSQIRIVNRYPTASPALHDIWRNEGTSRQLHQYLNSRARSSYSSHQTNDKKHYREAWNRLNTPVAKAQSFSIKELAKRYNEMLRAQNAGESLDYNHLLVGTLTLASATVSLLFGAFY